MSGYLLTQGRSGRARADTHCRCLFWRSQQLADFAPRREAPSARMRLSRLQDFCGLAFARVASTGTVEVSVSSCLPDREPFAFRMYAATDRNASLPPLGGNPPAAFL